jgi:uroporphyrinogen decarboxylase
MTNRERLLTVLSGGIPDCVPVMPDTSNMIPCKLTGKPFWDIYLYQDPPLWDAYIACAKKYDYDSLMDGYKPLVFPEDVANQPPWEPQIVFRSDERIVTQSCYMDNGKRVWAERVNVYYVADPPTHNVPPAKIGLPPVPEKWEPVEGRKEHDLGPEGYKQLRAQMGDQGLVGVYGIGTLAFYGEEGIINYYDHPELHDKWREDRMIAAERRFQQIMSMDEKPDFVAVGGSGTLIFQSPQIFRTLAFPAVQWFIEQCTAVGLPTQIHSCGPEKELVKIMAEESSLTIIDPLEIPPMGDCNLAELKRLYGHKLCLKGNVHTTDVMLRGTPDLVRRTCERCIDDAAEGGRYVLSTGDQCGRDTPEENLLTFVETARTYGRY